MTEKDEPVQRSPDKLPPLIHQELAASLSQKMKKDRQCLYGSRHAPGGPASGIPSHLLHRIFQLEKEREGPIRGAINKNAFRLAEKFRHVEGNTGKVHGEISAEMDETTFLVKFDDFFKSFKDSVASGYGYKDTETNILEKIGDQFLSNQALFKSTLQTALGLAIQKYSVGGLGEVYLRDVVEAVASVLQHALIKKMNMKKKAGWQIEKMLIAAFIREVLNSESELIKLSEMPEDYVKTQSLLIRKTLLEKYVKGLEAAVDYDHGVVEMMERSKELMNRLEFLHAPTPAHKPVEWDEIIPKTPSTSIAGFSLHGRTRREGMEMLKIWFPRSPISAIDDTLKVKEKKGDAAENFPKTIVTSRDGGTGKTLFAELLAAVLGWNFEKIVDQPISIRKLRGLENVALHDNFHLPLEDLVGLLPWAAKMRAPIVVLLDNVPIESLVHDNSIPPPPPPMGQSRFRPGMPPPPGLGMPLIGAYPLPPDDAGFTGMAALGNFANANQLQSVLDSDRGFYSDALKKEVRQGNVIIIITGNCGFHDLPPAVQHHRSVRALRTRLLELQSDMESKQERLEFISRFEDIKRSDLPAPLKEAAFTFLNDYILECDGSLDEDGKFSPATGVRKAIPALKALIGDFQRYWDRLGATEEDIRKTANKIRDMLNTPNSVDVPIPSLDLQIFIPDLIDLSRPQTPVKENLLIDLDESSPDDAAVDNDSNAYLKDLDDMFRDR